jgi:F420-dependent oxidoreductase-like protein
MRFGIFVNHGWRHDLVGIDPAQHWPNMKAQALHAEAGPWESIWVYDHFHTVPKPSEEATHEAWSLMAALSGATERIRLGQMCTCMSYRNPMYLAKVAATCDVISGGRMEFGIGGGWYEDEWRAYGYGFPSAGERLQRLDEGVQIMRQAWSTGYATFAGKHYTVEGARCFPRPLQEGGIPIWIAGGGEKVTLKIAAKYAQYTNFDGTLDVFQHKSRLLEQHCRNVGTEFDAITRTADYNVMIGRTADEVEERFIRLRERLTPLLPQEKVDSTVNSLRNMPAVGTPEQIVTNLEKLKGVGMAYAICYFPEAAYDTSGIDLFASEVIPALQ